MKNINLFYKTKKELDRLCSKEQISHQGLIAEIEHTEEKKLKEEEVWIRQGIKARRTRNEGRVRALEKMKKKKEEAK